MLNRHLLSAVHSAQHQKGLTVLLQKQVVSLSCPQALFSTKLKPKPHEASSKYKILVVGGGSGGTSVAAKFSKLGKQVAVIEPSPLHYYQPMWTLVGGGLKGFQASVQPTASVLPATCEWLQDRAMQFDPDNKCVTLESGGKVEYDYLVVAMGIQLNYGAIPGLEEALEHDSRVCSNYSPKWVQKTFPAIQQFQGGNAIFTFPSTPIKCAGAPQKIMYLAEEYFRTVSDVRDKTQVIFNTALGVIFGVKKYAESLHKVIADRDIKVNFQHNLVEVDHTKGTAIFEKLSEDKQRVPFQYDFMHVTPPMSSPDVLKSSPLVNEAGWVDVNKHTLQHTKYPNIFAIGDCSSLPTSKTAAAVAAQSGILHKNLQAFIDGKECTPLYDGYTSCPLITGRSKCILAEFDYNSAPLETLPLNQGKERQLAYAMKAYVMPELYWRVMMRGLWNGPGFFRKVLHLGLSRSPKI